MYRRIGAQRHNIFLGERLDAIGHRLKDSERPGAVGPDAVLNAAQPLALEYRGQGKQRRKQADDHHHAQHYAGRRLPPDRQKSNQPVPQ